MTTLNRHIRTNHSSIRQDLMMLWLLLTVLLTACSGSSDSLEEPETLPEGQSVLNIYVFAPGQAVPTRANEGEVAVNPDAENAINLLQIWVFTHEDIPGLVTYFETTTFMATSDEETKKFELPIPDDFANNASRPNVDVYVLANVSSLNCGLSFDENTSRDELENALLRGNYFGLSDTPATEVPFEGLPMSGVLRNQPVTGERPILTLGPSSSELAKVKLARAVSRVRFVFSCSNDFDGLKINSVTLDNGVIPDEEYLFLTDANNPYGYPDNDYNIKGTAYNVVDETHPAPSLFSISETAICADPAYYAWDRLVNDMTIQNPSVTSQALAEAYEALINEGLSSNVEATLSDDDPPIVIDPGHELPRLSERRVYLRESDKQLSGTITYQVKEKGATNYGSEQTATFVMDANGDFSRNHTWIVYSYLAWAKMNIVAIFINKWEKAEPADYTLYNW